MRRLSTSIPQKGYLQFPSVPGYHLIWNLKTVVAFVRCPSRAGDLGLRVLKQIQVLLNARDSAKLSRVFYCSAMPMEEVKNESNRDQSAC
jgi:hypothetical protein